MLKKLTVMLALLLLVGGEVVLAEARALGEPTVATVNAGGHPAAQPRHRRGRRRARRRARRRRMRRGE